MAGTSVPVSHYLAIPQIYPEKKTFLRLSGGKKSVKVAALFRRAHARFFIPKELVFHGSQHQEATYKVRNLRQDR
jgi:hypothetical protein